MIEIKKILIPENELLMIERSYTEGASVASLSREYGYSHHTIKSRLEELGVYKANKNYGIRYKWTESEIKRIIELYSEGKSAESIAKEYGCYDTTILNLLNKHGVSTKRRREFHNFKRYSVDEEYFNIIDTEDKAYWMGFLLADGHVTRDGKIMLTLQSRDLEHIEKFRESLSSNHPITKKSGQDAHEILIGSKIMGASLYEKGFHNRKSWGYDVDKITSSVPRELENHFIRGYFDGDGSVGVYKQTHYPDKKMFNFSILGIKPFLEYISNTTKICCQIKFDSRTKNNHFLITRSKSNILEYKDFLYSNANIFMHRKHDIFLEIEKL